jgi:hypothetical protein
MTACPLLDSQIREDMVLCALDALRLDGHPVTARDLQSRYGFSETACLAWADTAIGEAGRLFHTRNKETQT